MKISKCKKMIMQNLNFLNQRNQTDILKRSDIFYKKWYIISLTQSVMLK